MFSGQVNVPAGQWSMVDDGSVGAPHLFYNGPSSQRGILWGPDRKLDFWSALRAGAVPEREKRAVSLLASIADERRLSYYLLSGLFPALGNATKRIYMVRRFHTVVELDDGIPVASWCILTKDRHSIPETDHVVAMKNVIEGEEMAFREVGNCFEPNTDPFVGTVPLQSDFTNPYVNGVVASPKIRRSGDGRKIHDEQRILREETRLRNGDPREAAVRRAQAARQAAYSHAMKWAPGTRPQQMKPARRLSEFDRQLLRVRDQVAMGFGIPVVRPDGSLLS